MALTRKHYIRILAGLLITLVVTVVVAFNILLLWVASGPRSLDRFTPEIEAAFSSVNSHYKVKIGETWLLWDGWTNPIDIRLRNIAVLTEDNKVFSTFPEIAIGVHIPSLFAGRVLPTSIGFHHPVISLLQNADGTISFGFQKPDTAESAPDATVSFAVLLDTLLSNNAGNSLRKLRRVSISNADVSIGNVEKGVFFEAREVEFQAKRNRKGVFEMLSSARVRYGDYQSPVAMQFIMDKKAATINGSVEFQGVEMATLAKLFARRKELSTVTMPISGRAALAMDIDGNLKKVQFNIDGGYGAIESPELAGPVVVNWAHAEGAVSNNGNDIQLDKLSAQIEGMPIEANAVVSISGEDVAVRGDAKIKDVTVAKLPLLWPVKLAPITREWIIANISEGKVPEASTKINIEMGDLRRPILPKEALDTTIQLQDGKIRYIPEHPDVHNLQALIHIDGMALDANITSASYLKNTKISNARLLIEDLNPDNPYIKINLDVETSAKDAVHFLGLPRLKHAERLNMKEADIEGSVKGTAALGFYFFETADAKGKAENDIAFDIKADVAGISQPGFMKKFDIADASGAISINNKELLFKGKGSVNGVSASEADVRYAFVPENGIDTFIDVKANAPVSSLPRFGYPAFAWLKGNLGVQAKIKAGDAQEISQAAIDLTNASIAADAVGWNKPDKEAAVLDITTEKKNGKTTITAFGLKGNGLDTAGSATLNEGMTDIATLNLTRLLLGKTKLSTLNYAALPGGYQIEAAGSSLDVSGYLAARDKEPSAGFSFQNFPALQLKLDVDKVFAAYGQEINGLKGELDCDTRICSNANIVGKVGDKPFDFRILKNPKGKRQLVLHAQNAGAFMKAFDLYEQMEGGDLSLTGNFDEGPNGSTLHARLDISDHVIKKAPILTKILSLASLTGFIDTLEGNGLRFNKAMAVFTLANDVIKFERAKAYGPAIGLTVEGTITMPKIIFDLNGTVVPSYTLNSVAGKVPIIGDILTGGDGKGIFAASFTVKKTMDNPDVTVNPLSMLTPGFLRGIFE